MDRKDLKDRAEGCLLGGAVGDALGYPVEFVYSYKAIENEYGKGGIRQYDLRYPWLNHGKKEAQVSDDTQMTLYTLKALLESEKRNVPLMDEMRRQYLGWFYRQIGQKVPDELKSELTELDELNQRRAPGNTCLSALHEVSEGHKAHNSSKGCGGVMRVAPIGIWGALKGWSLEETARVAGETAEITHLHPLSSYSSAALAVMVQECMLAPSVTFDTYSAIVEKALDTLENLYGRDAKEMGEFRSLMAGALEQVGSPDADCKVIEGKLGEGWVAEETLAIAVFCVGRHLDDFRQTVVSAVNHGGDSDSTGAVAGNISGAIVGLNGIPEGFISDLQLTDFMLRMAAETMEE